MTANSQADTRRGNARPWFRLHWLSWIVLVLMTAGMTIVIVPGTLGTSIEYERSPLGPPYQSKYDFTEVSTWSHGWPFEHLRRAYSNDEGFLIDFEGYPVIFWSSPHAWQISGNVYAFSPLKFAANIVIGVSTVLIAVGTCETWRRRRGGFRFSLLDVAALISVVCIVLGWWQYHAHTMSSEQATKSAMMARGSLTDWSKGGPLRANALSDYHGPEWLSRLLGNGYYLPFCIHVDSLLLDSTLLSTDDYTDIPKFTYVDTVRCVDRLTPQLVESLAALPRLRAIDGRIAAFGGGVPYPEWMVTSSNVQLLTQLPRITHLYLGHSQLAPADLELLARLPRLKLLHIEGDDLLVEDLEPIVRCPSLRTLYLNISATEDERLAFTSSHSHLKVYWADSRRWTGFTEYTLVTDPRNVASVLFNRWQAEDGVEQPTSLEREWLDFSNIRLTRERLDRIPVKRFADVTSLHFGTVDSPETAIDLIRRCGPLAYLEARHIPLTARDLASISFNDESEIYLQQGPINVQEFCYLARKLKPLTLTICASTFTPEEVQLIAEAMPDGVADVYKDYAEEEDERIRPYDELDDHWENPFE
jgi:hypothetical protein